LKGQLLLCFSRFDFRLFLPCANFVPTCEKTRLIASACRSISLLVAVTKECSGIRALLSLNAFPCR